MNIPEAAIGAAVEVLLHGWLRYKDPDEFARAILQAAAPFLKEQP